LYFLLKAYRRIHLIENRLLFLSFELIELYTENKNAIARKTSSPMTSQGINLGPAGF